MEMSCGCCVENCFNNARSQANLNFYILPSYKQQYWCWLQVIGPAEVDKKKDFGQELVSQDTILCLF